jgi:hypothetical protein
MSERAVLCDLNLISAFALIIGGALTGSLPLTLLIIWICG